MNDTIASQITPFTLLLSLLGAFVAGLVVLAWGRRLPRQGDWLVSLGLLGILGVVFLSWSPYFSGGPDRVEWLLGWIWPRQEKDSITVGALKDSLGLTMAALAALLTAFVVVPNRALLAREPRPERLYAAAGIAVCGVGLSWVSLTVWMAFAGIFITTLGGFLSFGSRWNTDREAEVAARFGWERLWGLLLCLLGASALLSGGNTLVWVAQANWPTDTLARLGAGLLVLGLMIQLQPFPLLGWVVLPTEQPSALRVLLAQVLPGWSAYAVLSRLEPQLTAVGVLPVFAWIALASAALTTITGVMQSDWRQAMSAWVSAGLSLAVAALGFAGATAGLSILLGSGISAVALSLLGTVTCLPEKGGKGAGNGAGRFWARFAAFFAAASGTGVLGFVGVGGSIEWHRTGLADPIRAALFALGSFLSAMLAWRVAWLIARRQGPLNPETSSGPVTLVWPYLTTLLAAGFAWTGTLSGNAIPEDPDRVLPSALGAFFGTQGRGGDSTEFLSASWLHWGALVAAVAVAYWSTARKQDSWAKFHAAFPRAATFLGQGYGIDALVSRVRAGMNGLGLLVQNVVDRGVWGQWIPSGLRWTVQFSGRAVSTFDRGVSRRIDRNVRRSVEIPAKLLQLVQSGDVQWYLFFAVGSGIAVLLHFLRF